MKNEVPRIYCALPYGLRWLLLADFHPFTLYFYFTADSGSSSKQINIYNT